MRRPAVSAMLGAYGGDGERFPRSGPLSRVQRTVRITSCGQVGRSQGREGDCRARRLTWSYSNTGYILAGLIVQAATGHRLGQELTRRIFRPLGLRNTYFPVNWPTIPGRNARGYSIDPFAQEPGPLLDLTVYNPSLAWAAGALVSNLTDLQRFFRVLLGGRLLPPRLLAEMTTSVDTGVPGFGYGLGVAVIGTPTGRVIGHDGAIPGFLNILGSLTQKRSWELRLGITVETTENREGGSQAVQAPLRSVRGGSVSQRSSTGMGGHQRSPTVGRNRRSRALRLKQLG
jgi:hypothetical protein